jgi:hypothetical protein
VHAAGEYTVRLMLNSQQAEKMTFSITSGDQTVSNALMEGKGQNIGTLVRYEGAYWDNFDLPETFKSSIRNFDVGTLILTKNSKTLKVELGALAPDFDARLTNQIIAIQLIKQHEIKQLSVYCLSRLGLLTLN